MKTNNLFNILKTATAKQSLITVSSTVISGGLGALFYILLARFLGPSDFGIIIFCITTLTLLADVADIGTNTGLVHFVSSNLKRNEQKALQFLKLSLEIKFFVWILVLLLGYILIPTISENIFNKSELILPLRLSLIGVGGALLFSFATSALQAFQKFNSWGIILVITNLARILLIIMLLISNQLSLFNSLIIFTTLPFLGFFLALLLLPTKSFIQASPDNRMVKEFLKFNRFVALFILIGAISSRMDVFLNAKFLNIKEVGIYGAASQLTSFIPQIVSALGVVAAPKFASFTNLTVMLAYFKKLQIMVMVLAGVSLLVIPLSGYFIPLFFGSEYIGSINVFIVLFLSMLVFLISLPAQNAILYYFSRPQIFVIISLGHLIIVSILGYILTTNFSIIGTAAAVLVGFIFNFLASLIYFLISVQNNEKNK